MNNLPEFESKFLTSLSASYSKVRRSLKYNSHSLSFTKVLDRVNDEKVEKIELSIQSSRSIHNIRIRLYAWSDRWVWIDARKSESEGWAWEYTTEGRLNGSASERALMAALKSFNENSILYDQHNILEKVIYIGRN